MITKHTLIVMLLSLGFCLVVIGLFAGFYYYIDSKQKQLTENTRHVAELRANSNELATLMNVVTQSAAEREKLFTYVLTEEDVIDFLALLETLAAEQGIEYKTENINEKKHSNQFKTLTLNISAYGAYQGVVHFIALLETLPYQSSISEINLIKDNEKEPADWKVTLVLTAIQRTTP